MKTIKDLNSKMFYRAIKVLYFFIVAGLLIISTLYLYEDNKYYPMDYSQSRITCKIVDVQRDITKSDYGIEGRGSLYFSLFTEERKEIKKIAKEICLLQNPDFEIINTNKDREYLISNNIFTASEGVMVDWFHTGKFIFYTFLIFLSLFIATEILKRAIYYIFLGGINPK